MQFVDYAKIHVKAGDGGRGCVSFRREKYIPRGGPNGGDGGRGGHIIIKATGKLNTLLDQKYKREYKAGRGQHGMGKKKHGKSGEERWLIFELKLLADVGLIGLPNAGKSTLISVISSARPKIAEYPFTTLVPNLGVVRLEDFRSFVVADIPGSIEGAHKGAGLGFQFLRHVERTSILLHLIDISYMVEGGPADNFGKLNKELG